MQTLPYLRVHFFSGLLNPKMGQNSVPLLHHDLELICLVKKRKIRFRILSDLRIQSWSFLKKRTLSHTFLVHFNGTSGEFGQAMVCIFVRRSKVKIPVVRQNEPDVLKHNKKL